MSDPAPRLGWPHLLMFVPGLGAAVVLVLATARQDPGEKAELMQAARWQGGAFGVLAVHGVLQAAIWFIAWLVSAMPQELVSQSPTYEYLPLMLGLCTHANLFAGAAEWLVLAFFGFKAARGAPYPARGKIKS